MAAMTDEIKVYDESYPTRRLLELIGDKWTPIIVYLLSQGTKRYGELQRHLPDVSKKMLTQTLRALERDGLLKRKVYAEGPHEEMKRKTTWTSPPNSWQLPSTLSRPISVWRIEPSSNCLTTNFTSL